MKYITSVADKEYNIEIDHEGVVVVNGESYTVDIRKLGDAGIHSLLLNNQSYEAVVNEDDAGWEVLLEGELYSVKVQDEWAYLMAQARVETARESGEVTIKSPMPGIIVKIPVPIGEVVEKGDAVVILESMKMENELKSPRAGIVSRILVKVEATVEKGQALAIIGDVE